MNLDAIAIGHNPPEDVNTIIEVPIGGEPIKYEMDKAAGTLVVDRFLYTPMRYPGNYGFVPHTLSDDGDPIDVLVANTRPIIPGAVMNVRPIGVLRMEDDAGGDEKIIAVPSSRITQRYVNVKTLHRPARDHASPDRALLRPLQGPRARQVGEASGLGRRRRSPPPHRRGDRAGEAEEVAHRRKTPRVSSSIGKKLSIRSSCSVTSCGVPSVAMVVNSRSAVCPFWKSIGSTGPSPADGVGLRHRRPHAGIAQQPLQQGGGLRRAVDRRIGLDAAHEVADDLRPVRQVRSQHVGADQGIGEIDRRAGLHRADQELDHRHGALVGLQQVPAAIDDDGGEGLLLRQHVVERARGSAPAPAAPRSVSLQAGA